MMHSYPINLISFYLFYSVQDSDALSRAQQAILQLQAEVERLHRTTSDIIDENNRRTKQIQVKTLFRQCRFSSVHPVFLHNNMIQIVLYVWNIQQIFCNLIWMLRWTDFTLWTHRLVHRPGFTHFFSLCCWRPNKVSFQQNHWVYLCWVLSLQEN